MCVGGVQQCADYFIRDGGTDPLPAVSKAEGVQNYFILSILARQHTGTVFVFLFSPARLTSTQGEEQLVSLAWSSFFAFEE